MVAAVLGARIAYGAGLLLAPGPMTRRWLGVGSAAPPARVAIRALGAREIALHGAAWQAIRSGQTPRPWLAASIAGDLTDIVATVVDRGGLPDGSARATLAVAGASALLTVALMVSEPG
jgi:hypothetical protein